ncbi:hypothetical protein ACU61A_41070 [Pseudonocardia sichuanensis]
MTTGTALLAAATLLLAAWMWWQQWITQPTPVVLGAAGKIAFGRSDRDTIALATAAGILLAEEGAARLVEATAWVGGITGLDAAAWAPAGADAIVLAAVVAALADLALIGLWRGEMLRPALRHSLIGLLLPSLLVAGWPLLAQTTSDAAAAIGQVPPPPTCTPPVQGDAIGGYGPEQLANAAVIVQVGREMGISERGQVIAVATAMQESTLRNLNHGDRDSLGLFQQRPSQGWGSPAEVTDPRYAARKFYDGLQGVRGWDELPLWQSAQAVQRSAYPTAYAKHERTAAQLVGAATNVSCPSGRT